MVEIFWFLMRMKFNVEKEQKLKLLSELINEKE